MNIEALNQGYTLMKEQLNDLQGDFKLQTTEENPHLYMIGNDAIGLGAISGSRFMAYPITPASEIMEYMIANVTKVGGTVVQTEDEIAPIWQWC